MATCTSLPGSVAGAKDIRLVADGDSAAGRQVGAVVQGEDSRGGSWVGSDVPAPTSKAVPQVNLLAAAEVAVVSATTAAAAAVPAVFAVSVKSELLLAANRRARRHLGVGGIEVVGSVDGVGQILQRSRFIGANLYFSRSH